MYSAVSHPGAHPASVMKFNILVELGSVWGA